MPNYSCHKHHLHCFAVHYLIIASCETAASTLQDFLRKGMKGAKMHKLCRIMLINPS